MTSRWLALATGAFLFLHAPAAPAEPILKAHKYEGPIPQSSISVRIGALGGASNDEMIDYLDGRLKPPFVANTQDFGSALAVEITYIHKPHPRFGLRANASAAFLRSTGDGLFVPQIPNLPDSVLLPEVTYNREFNVDLFTVELSGIYYFTDASVNDFQPYFGAGFSVGIPHETFKESRTEVDTGQPYPGEVPGIPSEASEWSMSAGVHAVLGLLYYIDERWAISSEARAQLMEGQFKQLQVYDPDIGEFDNVRFVVDYTGFYLSVGMSYGF